MGNWNNLYKKKLVSAEEAVQVVQPGDRVFYSIGNSAPVDLVNALSRRLPELGSVTFLSGCLVQPFEYLTNLQYGKYFKHYCLFRFNSERASPSQESITSYLFHFSRVDELLADESVKPNVMMCECPPPDDHGYFNYGCCGVYCNSFVARNATKIIVQVNENAPYVCGEQNVIHISQVDHVVEKNHDLVEVPMIPITDVEKEIATLLMDRIEDGSTLQIGVGGLANAVCSMLENKKDLGIYTEMFADSFLDLIEKGIINGSKKTWHPGEMSCSFGPNTKRGFDFVNKNPLVRYYPVTYINNPFNIAKNEKFVSINNALMVDLTGQVCSESLGFKQFSGTGGQVDFARGAAMSKEGQSFMTLPSCVNGKSKPMSRIVLSLPPGQAVTTPRTDVDKVVTEYGIAELRNRSISERAKEMIKISHPQFREELMLGAKQAGLL